MAVGISVYPPPSTNEEVTAIKAVTDLIPDGGALTTISNNITTVDTVVDGIKAVTDLLPNAGALKYLLPVVPALEWGETVGRRYAARFIAAELFPDAAAAGTGSLVGRGWFMSGAGAADESSGTSDINSQADNAVGPSGTLGAGPDYLASPAVIGGWSQLQSIGLLYGAPTTITVSIIAEFSSTTDNATDGIGIGNTPASAGNAAGNFGISCGATNFAYTLEGAAAVSTGVVKDTNPHLFQFVITISSRSTVVKIDGATVATVVQAEDLWPKHVIAHSTGTNSVQPHGFFVEYD